MADDLYKCYKCSDFNRYTHTCKREDLTCKYEDEEDTDIFRSSQRSPESFKTRREHLSDMTSPDLARFITRVISKPCTVCEYRATCSRRIGTDICIDGVSKWLEAQKGIYD